MLSIMTVEIAACRSSNNRFRFLNSPEARVLLFQLSREVLLLRYSAAAAADVAVVVDGSITLIELNRLVTKGGLRKRKWWNTAIPSPRQGLTYSSRGPQ